MVYKMRSQPDSDPTKDPCLDYSCSSTESAQLFFFNISLLLIDISFITVISIASMEIIVTLTFGHSRHCDQVLIDWRLLTLKTHLLEDYSFIGLLLTFIFRGNGTYAQQEY